MEEQFQSAAKILPSIITKLSSEDLLYFYARYKQSTIGNCNTDKPGFFDFQGKQKWTAWKSLESMTKETAMKEYIEKMNQVYPEWTDQNPEDITDPSWVCQSSMPKPVVQDKDKDFLYYIQEGEIGKVEDFLGKEPKLVNQICEDLYPIHWAADRGNFQMVQILLKHGADINVQDEDGQTALHYACSNEHQSVIKVLLDSFVDKSIKDQEGLMAVDVLNNDEIKSKFF